ncbi:YceD family protein [Methylotenera sp. L2L1]|uniref:YceD family protein n=1 Tax=Methylotenera sp. L2L1 TaxID=1502770 RepID=UPI000565DA9B|nr:YceD family protein [Methylotenera sp. L2L1]
MTNQTFLIDNLAFAARGERLEVSLPLSDFPRLCELIESQHIEAGAVKKHGDATGDSIQPEGLVNFTLNGEKNVLGQCYLHLTLDVSLTTSCQRCLTTMPLSLALNFHYLISDVDASPLDDVEASIGDDFDLQEASQEMDVKLLVEDEIILALPIAPVHSNDCAPVTMQSGEKPNPFAALKGLIKS